MPSRSLLFWKFLAIILGCILLIIQKFHTKKIMAASQWVLQGMAVIIFFPY